MNDQAHVSEPNHPVSPRSVDAPMAFGLAVEAETLREYVYAGERIDTECLRDALKMSSRSLAGVLGLSYEAIRKRDRANSRKTQERMRDMVAILDRVTPWAGSRAQALAWYRSQEVPSLGLTAEQAVKTGRSRLVWAYLGRISEGGYA